MVGHRDKAVFTTGEVAKICNVSQQTVIRCFDSGRLEGHRVPGSRFRRIPREALMRFMKTNGIPLDNLEDGKRKVLVVDDDQAIIDMFSDLLGEDGRFDIRTAQSGYAAGMLTQEFRPDIILLDYMLPDINGTEVCRTIRANPKFEHIKIICISGVADPDQVRELEDAGIDAFVRKPFNIKAMIVRMVDLLNLS